MAAQSRRSVAASRPELFFALVRPTGCLSEDITAAMKAELARVGYTVASVVKVSHLLHSMRKYAALKDFEGPEDQRIEKHMNAGDELRETLQDGGALAYLAAREVFTHRPEDPKNIAWVIDSLKHKREVDVLRGLYGDQLLVVSVYADEDERVKALGRRIARSWGTHEEAEEKARKLIHRDQEGADTNAFGQDVRSTFPLADYFISATNNVRGQVGRMVETLFGRPTRSPSRDEYAMSMARSAALRSADLSRQVGAVIVDGDGEVIVAGCNEVPKPGGGVYWEGDPDDSRDCIQGFDPNATTSREMLIEVFKSLKERGWLAKSVSGAAPTQLAERARKEQVLEKDRVTNLVEFGRIVHAEMNALLRAAAAGLSIRSMRMVCTTFPCHVCARHLLGSGLSEVVYIEPYPKSMAPDQYPNAIAVGERKSPGMLRFSPFIGWSPVRYTRIFQFGKRKDDTGYLQTWDPYQAFPKIGGAPDAHRNFERDLIARTNELLTSVDSPRATGEGRRTRTKNMKRTKR